MIRSILFSVPLFVVAMLIMFAFGVFGVYIADTFGDKAFCDYLILSVFLLPCSLAGWFCLYTETIVSCLVKE